MLLVLGALRLLSLNLVAHQTLEAYQAGDRAKTLEWGERQGWVNFVEQFRSPFAIGDAYVLTGAFEQARPWFEQALDQVPKGGIEECKVRVNLGLTYEALGDAAKAKERTTEWKQFYEKGIQTTSQRPPVCDAPEGAQTGEQLEQAQERMEDKSAEQQGQPEQPPDEPGDSPGQQPTPAAAADPGRRQDAEPGAAGPAAGAAAAEHHRAQPGARRGRPRRDGRRRQQLPQALVSRPGVGSGPVRAG